MVAAGKCVTCGDKACVESTAQCKNGKKPCTACPKNSPLSRFHMKALCPTKYPEVPQSDGKEVVSHFEPITTEEYRFPESPTRSQSDRNNARCSTTAPSPGTERSRLPSRDHRAPRRQAADSKRSFRSQSEEVANPVGRSPTDSLLRSAYDRQIIGICWSACHRQNCYLLLLLIKKTYEKQLLRKSCIV